MHISLLYQSPEQAALIMRVLDTHTCRHEETAGDLQQQPPHLLILEWRGDDTRMPDILDWAASASIPVLLTVTAAASNLKNLPAAVGLGMTDYLLAPLRRHELAARVQVLLQRAYPDHDERQQQHFAGYQFETPTNLISLNGKPLAVTQKEFALALLLFNNLGRPLSRAFLQEAIWGREDEIPSRTMDTHISRVRNKLQLRPENGFRLNTVYGYGYQLEPLTAATN